MILRRVSLLGFAGLHDVEHEFAAPVTVVTGEAASGKTTFLLTLIAAIETFSRTGARVIDLHADPPRSGAKARLSLAADGVEVDTEVIADSPMEQDLVEHPRALTSMFAWNFDRRLVLLHENRHFDAAPGDPSLGELREPTSRKHAGAVQFLARAARDPRRRQALDAFLAAAGTRLACDVDEASGESRILRSGVVTPWFTLSDSERAVLLVATEVLRHASGESLVLIDTIERSVSPRTAEAMLRALPALSPRAQFVVTTRLERVDTGGRLVLSASRRLP